MITAVNILLNFIFHFRSIFSKFNLIPIIIALAITMALILTLAFVRVNYLIILIFIFTYLLDILISIILLCKTKFDKRFLQ